MCSWSNGHFKYGPGVLENSFSPGPCVEVKISKKLSDVGWQGNGEPNYVALHVDVE